VNLISSVFSGGALDRLVFPPQKKPSQPLRQSLRTQLVSL
jgi:hypothetical protein